MVDVDDKNEWKECIDIGGVRLPTGYYFGASAATGDLSGKSTLYYLKYVGSWRVITLWTSNPRFWISFYNDPCTSGKNFH